MSESWRQLDLGRQGPYENGATMPVLVRSVAESGRPVMQTSVWGETHLNVGWFDDVDATLDLERCAGTRRPGRPTDALRRRYRVTTEPSVRPCGVSSSPRPATTISTRSSGGSSR
ncbi:MAG: hypothetical protein U5R31_01045 [Acidimicrobiia bacterium]|nr:hypothetical protein [Acidimicrobiia bacterium]